MSEETGKLPAISNTLTQQTSSVAAAVLVLILVMMFVAFELGELLSAVRSAKDDAAKDAKNNYTEIRVLQQHIEDLNAVLVSHGIIKPGEVNNPTGAHP